MLVPVIGGRQSIGCVLASASPSKLLERGAEHVCGTVVFPDPSHSQECIVTPSLAFLSCARRKFTMCCLRRTRSAASATRARCDTCLFRLCVILPIVRYGLQKCVSKGESMTHVHSRHAISMTITDGQLLPCDYPGGDNDCDLIDLGIQARVTSLVCFGHA